MKRISDFKTGCSSQLAAIFDRQNRFFTGCRTVNKMYYYQRGTGLSKIALNCICHLFIN